MFPVIFILVFILILTVTIVIIGITIVSISAFVVVIICQRDSWFPIFFIQDGLFELAPICRYSAVFKNEGTKVFVFFRVNNCQEDFGISVQFPG